ncbi:MAG TPA: carbonic anhydrase family protein [Polyangiales bacterium]|nr:carbonic anhydrase family protein [Polyangiales bacterium]
MAEPTETEPSIVDELPTDGTVAPWTKERRDNATADEIIEAMKRGNRRYSEGKLITRSLLHEQRASVSGQYPAAMVLSCVDSRAPIEIIMDAGIGRALNARVAGNVANDDTLGSMEFACQLAGAKVALVMGHTACGAIKGAINNVQLGNLTSLLRKIYPAIEATEYDGERSATNYTFVNAVARKHVQLTMNYIRTYSPVLRDLEQAGKIKIIGGMYDLETALIDFID